MASRTLLRSRSRASSGTASRALVCTILFSLSTMIVLAFAACGGSTLPGGYKCGDVSAGHCYGETYGVGHLLLVTPAEQLYGLYGFSTSVLVASTLDGGDGFIDNEFWLRSYNCYCWVEVGYWNLGYFVAEQRPDGKFYKLNLFAMSAADVNQYAVLDIHAIGAIGSSVFSVSISNKATSFVTTVTDNAMWRTQTSWWTDGYSYGFVEMGQELAGTNGAAASFVFFAFNRWYDSNGVSQYLVGGSGDVSYAAPPYAGWLVLPTALSDQGGLFWTECCTSHL